MAEDTTESATEMTGTGGAAEEPTAQYPPQGHQMGASSDEDTRDVTDGTDVEAPASSEAIEQGGQAISAAPASDTLSSQDTPAPAAPEGLATSPPGVVEQPEQAEVDSGGDSEVRRLVVTSREASEPSSIVQEVAHNGATAEGRASVEPEDTADSPAALRAENERLRAELSAVKQRAQRPETPHPKRRALVGTLVVLSCISLLFSTLTLWSQQTFLNNDARWAEIVGPVGRDPAVVNAVSAYVADQVVTALQVQQRAQNALPERAQFLSVPLTDAVRQYTQKGVARAMQTEQFQQAWIVVNNAVHTEVVAALRGQSENITVSGGVVTLNLLPIITEGLHTIRGQIEGLLPPQVTLPDPRSTEQVQQGIQRLSQALGVQLPANFGQVTLFQADQLTTAQQIVRLIDLFAILLPLLTLVLLIATLWLSVDRRRTLIQLGIGIAITFALAKIGIAVLQQTIASSIANPTAKDIVDPVIARALSYLVTSTTWLLVFGLVVALVAFLVGKPEWFRVAFAKTRQAYTAASDWTRQQLAKREHGGGQAAMD